MNHLQQQRQALQAQIASIDAVIAKQAELQQQQIELEQSADTEKQLHQAKLHAYNDAVTTAKTNIDQLDIDGQVILDQINQLQAQIKDLHTQFQSIYQRKQAAILLCKDKWIDLHNKPFGVENKSHFKADMLSKVTANKQLLNDSVGF